MPTQTACSVLWRRAHWMRTTRVLVSRCVEHADRSTVPLESTRHWGSSGIVAPPTPCQGVAHEDPNKMPRYAPRFCDVVGQPGRPQHATNSLWWWSNSTTNRWRIGRRVRTCAPFGASGTPQTCRPWWLATTQWRCSAGCGWPGEPTPSLGFVCWVGGEILGSST